VTAAAPSDEALRLEGAFTDVSDRAGPAVVSIVSSYTVVHRFSPWGDEGLDDLFGQFFGTPPQREMQEPVVSAGSGVIVSRDGYILTNAHVIGRAKNVSVKLLDKREYKAAIVGMDEDTDICVLRIKADGPLVAAPLGDSDAIRVGSWAIAIGNPFGLENTVTVGVISAKGRRLDESSGGRTARFTGFIQTDASINRGNSGGPLINIRGEVIGINTMIYSPSGGSVGIGFAIPVNIAKSVMDSLIKEGKIVRPQLGVAYRPVAPEVAKKLKLPAGTGMEVSQVLPGTAAERAGLKAGDIILSVDGKPLKDQEDLRNAVLQHKVGDRIQLDVFRRNARLKLEVILKESAHEAAEDHPKESQKAPGEERSWLGMTVQDLTEDLARQLETRNTEGVLVTRVAADSRAQNSGIQRGDVIREIEQQAVHNLKEFEEVGRRLGDKDGILVLVERRGSVMYIVIERPAKGGGE
jgi:Do/DeqQ family serine protease